MSHFCTIVIVPKNVEDVEKEVANLLHPYDENISVDDYDAACYCVNLEAHKFSREAASTQLGGSIDEVERKAFLKELSKKCLEQCSVVIKDENDVINEWDKFKKENIPTFDKLLSIEDKIHDELSPLWKQLMKTRTELEDKIMKDHPLYNQPNPNCCECDGTGLMETSYNPLSKWDWWQIGGRWTGCLSNYDPTEDPKNKETCSLCHGTGMRNDKIGIEMRNQNPHYTCNGCGGKGMSLKWSTRWVSHKDNILPVENIAEDFASFAVVTPDGEWHEKGQMGWFGMAKDEKSEEDWKLFCQDIFKKYAKDYLAVVVDCHI